MFIGVERFGFVLLLRESASAFIGIERETCSLWDLNWIQSQGENRGEIILERKVTRSSAS